jgi:tetratricopeptide (TPR) repeat protein
MSSVWVGLLAFLVLQAATPAIQAPAVSSATAPAEELRRGRNSFDRGEYARAIEILRPLLYPDVRLESDVQIVQAHRMLGVAELFQGNNDAASQEFRKLLQLRPDYRFDPLLDPPQVVDFFNGVLRTHERELATLEAKQQEAARARQRDREQCEKLRAGPAVVERRINRHSFAVNFVPFGAGQFQNSQRSKGWAFFGVQTGLAAVSLAAFSTNLALYGLRPKRGCRYDFGATPCPPEFIDRTDQNRSRWLLRTQIVSGAAFFGAVVWGVLDAIYYYRSEIPLAPTPVVSPNAQNHGLSLSPVLLGQGLGPGLHFRF